MSTGSKAYIRQQEHRAPSTAQEYSSEHSTGIQQATSNMQLAISPSLKMNATTPRAAVHKSKFKDKCHNGQQFTSPNLKINATTGSSIMTN